MDSQFVSWLFGNQSQEDADAVEEKKAGRGGREGRDVLARRCTALIAHFIQIERLRGLVGGIRGWGGRGQTVCFINACLRLGDEKLQNDA